MKSGRARRGAAWAVISVAAALACRSSDSRATSGPQTVTTTLGDTTVVRTLAIADSSVLLRLVPELRIGDPDGAEEYTFAMITELAPSPRGGVYAWDQGLTVLREYDSTGTFVRQIGRKGSGPGEYLAANGIVTAPDGRLVLWDARNARISLYSPDGTYATAFRAPSTLHTNHALQIDSAGRLYIEFWPRPMDARTGAPPPVGMIRLSLDGTVIDSVVSPRTSFTPATLVASRDGATAMYGVPFAPQRIVAMSAFGQWITGNGERYAITVQRDGQPMLRIERDVPQVEVRPEEHAEAERRITWSMRQTFPEWTWAGPAMPSRKPFVLSVLADADGRIWVRRSMPAERIASSADDEQRPRQESGPPPRQWAQPIAYDIFDRGGRLLGHLPVGRAQLMHVRGDRVWAVVRDSLEVPYVTRFRVEPSLATRQ